VTTIPQIRDSKFISTYGKLISFVIPKNATPAQVVSDISIINILTSDESLKKMTEISYLPPVKRNLLVGNPNDAYLDIFNKSALIANAWYDPSEKETDLLFKDMVESVASGKDSPESAAVSAQGQLEILIKNLISKKN
jgi:ABC-type glycerol-3-phosphate transport system substrate-binding protein